MKQLQLLAIISLLMVVTISNVYAGGPRLDYSSDDTEEGAYCWVDGFDAGFAGKYDKNRAKECLENGQDEYNASWGFACTNGGHSEKECGDAINNPVDLGTHAQLEEQNRRNCYDNGFKDGKNSNSFNEDRDHACDEYSNSYGDGFSAGCESIDNTDDTCELIIKGHENYCPDNPDDPACTEFLHNATKKKPAEVCNSPSGCFKDQDAEKYCLNYNDTTFCKTVGDICDTGGFVKPEDAYCKGVTD